MSYHEINRTWNLYRRALLVGKSKEIETEAVKAFVAAWGSAYKYMWGLIHDPQPDAVQKLKDLQEEIQEITESLTRGKQ